MWHPVDHGKGWTRGHHARHAGKALEVAHARSRGTFRRTDGGHRRTRLGPDHRHVRRGSIERIDAFKLESRTGSDHVSRKPTDVSMVPDGL